LFNFLSGKLARQYTLAIVALTGVLMLIAGVIQTYLAFQGSYQHAQQNGQNIAELIEHEMTSQLARVKDLINLVSDSRTTAQSSAITGFNLELDARSQLRHYPMVTELWFYTKDSAILGLNLTRRLFDKPTDAQYQAVKTGRTDVLLDARQYYPYLYQHKAQTGAMGEAVLAKVNLDTINVQLGKLIPSAEHIPIYYVLNESAQLLTTSDRLTAFSKAHFSEKPFYQHMLSAVAKTGSSVQQLNGQYKWVNWRRADSGWLYIAEQPIQALLEPIIKSIAASLIVLLIGVSLAVLVGRRLALRMAKPVESLAQVTEQLAKGEFGQRALVTSHDELGTLATGFNKMADELQSLYQGLEQKVAEKTAQLEIEHALREKQSAQIAVLEERTRIMRDIHDGLGGTLVGLSGAVKQKTVDLATIEGLVQEVMMDFRIAIDSLTPEPMEAVMVLASMRHRLEPRLKLAGLAMVWQLGEVRERPVLTREQVFHLQRILAEAFTNVIKHAQATVVTVSLVDDSEGLLITIADNGRGYRADNERGELSRGRGLESMQQRALQLGAQLNLATGSTKGTTLSLRLPDDYRKS
jgi:signal transduction histidine kinase